MDSAKNTRIESEQMFVFVYFEPMHNIVVIQTFILASKHEHMHLFNPKKKRKKYLKRNCFPCRGIKPLIEMKMRSVFDCLSK